MFDPEALNSSEDENLCVVCFKNAEIYSIGVCDHPVCYECSTRMRVLCRQNECPICRQDMPKVVFTKTIEQFSSLLPKFERSNLQDRKHGLIFCTLEIKLCYDKILEHRCQVCRNSERNWPFKTFQQLKDHLRRDHELFFCDICVENLRIFTSERRCYTRQELAHHRRKGDPDNTSHRGHPLCEFCDTRYMDSDELFRHLRRYHFYCHFCDADGKHQYYNSINDLVRHFKEEHYLCEEGDCKAVPLTAVFRTDIDLKAHIATEHGKYMSKHATKQARTLELEFTLAPRSRIDNTRNKRYNDRRDRSDEDGIIGSYNMEPGGPGGGDEGASGMFVNPLTPQDFPALRGSNMPVQRPITTVNFTSKVNSSISREDFPILGSSRYSATPEVTITRTRNNDFPALGRASSNPSNNASSTLRFSVNSSQDPNSAKVSIQVNHRPNGGITTHITTSASNSTQQRPTEAFPALGNTTTVTQPQWVKVKNKKQEPKASKVAPTPQLPPSSLEQFPTLSKKVSENSNSANNWVNLNNINTVRNNTSSKQKESSAISKNNNSVNESNKKTEKPSSSKNRNSTIETRVQNIKITESTESKNKNKKKKSKGVENESNKIKVQSMNSYDQQTTEDSMFKPDMENETLRKADEKSTNGMVKRSELKIGTLMASNEASNLDFPALEETKPPPGFSMKPPPGLSPSAFPSLGANDLTFTTSRGQSYSITPSSSYHQPNNFQVRNQNLIKRLLAVLNNNDSIKEFKTYSDLFRNGGYPTANYFDHCKTVLGNSFDDIFPELLVLLPDIQKQQDLYKFYEGRNKKNLVVCEHCKQIIFKKELSDHYNYHVLENQFPILGKVHHVENNVWQK